MGGRWGTLESGHEQGRRRFRNCARNVAPLVLVHVHHGQAERLINVLLAYGLGLKLEARVMHCLAGRRRAQARPVVTIAHARSKFVMAFAPAMIRGAAGKRFAASLSNVIRALERRLPCSWIDPVIDVCACAFLRGFQRSQGAPCRSNCGRVQTQRAHKRRHL